MQIKKMHYAISKSCEAWHYASKFNTVRNLMAQGLLTGKRF